MSGSLLRSDVPSDSSTCALKRKYPMPIAQVNGMNLFYRVDGHPEGPPVVFISGLGGDHRRWEGIVGLLGDTYRCITFDNRDAGHSGRASSPYTIRDMAQDLAGLLTELGISSAHVVGNSMGGAIAQELALSYPEVVRRLVLVSTYTSGDPRGSAIFQSSSQLRRRLSREEYQRALLPWVYTVQEYQMPGFIEEAVRLAQGDPLYQEPEAYDRQVQATITFSSEDRLHRITHSTLLVFGEDDIMTPLRFARQLNQGISNSRLVILAGTGHGLLNTRTGEVLGLIDGFLREGGE